jgi:hypothetical protein
VVECDLAKVEVAGSNPVSRSIAYPGYLSLPVAKLCDVVKVLHAVRGSFLRRYGVRRRLFRFQSLTYRQGAVPKW